MSPSRRPTCTGSIADHRLRLAARQVADLAPGDRARAWASRGSRPAGGSTAVGPAPFVAAVVADLKAHRGSSLVIAGVGQPPRSTRWRTRSTGARQRRQDGRVHRPGRGRAADQLAGAPRARRGHEGRQGRDPGDPRRQPGLRCAGRSRLRRRPREEVKTTIRLGLYEDETSKLCQWHVPEAHPLESWGDALAFDGTATIVQPLIAPLYGGKSALEFVAALASGQSPQGLNLVQTYWKGRKPGGNFDAFWRKSLRDGVVADYGREAEEYRRSSRSARCRPLRSRHPADSRSSSGPTPPSGTAGSPTTAGSRNCPSRSPSSPGTTPRSSRRRRPRSSGSRSTSLRRIRRHRADCRRPDGSASRPGRPGPGRRRRSPSTSATVGPVRAAWGRASGFDAYPVRTSGDALVRRERDRGEDRQDLPARERPAPQHDGEPRARPGRDARRSTPSIPSSPRSPTSTSSARRRCTRTPCPSTAATRSTRAGSARGTPGAWRSTSTPASAATPASSPARPRTTSRSWARSRCS